MGKMPKKVAVIGLDCALTHLIDQHIAEGHLPTFKKLFESSVVAENCLTNYPTITPPGWATIATGALAGTHQVTDFTIHKLGTTPSNTNTFAAFSSENVKAEFIWDAADKAGKKCIVLNYPGAHPSNMKNGIMVGGGGLSVGEYRNGLPGLGSAITISHDMMITTGLYPNAIRGKFAPAAGWSNLAVLDDEPLEMEAKLNFPMAAQPLAETTWWVLARESEGDGYDTVLLSPTKDAADAFCELKPGQWSDKVSTTFQMADGSQQNGFFQAKLIELSDDAEDFRLFISGPCKTEGWASPEEIAAELADNHGVFAPGGGVRGYAVGWFELDTYVQINDRYSQWLADTANTLMSNHEWDMFYMHSHPPDWVYHAIMTEMDPNTCSSQAAREAAWEAHLKIYQGQDRMIAHILEAIDEDETMVVMVSDHGATPDGPKINPYDILVPAGLATPHENQISEEALKEHMLKSMGVDDKARMSIYDMKAMQASAFIVDLEKTKALPQRSIYIYVNLKGRDPGGIVEPEDYEKVQRQIIDALYSYVDPGTGKRPIALALSKQDARILGLYGDQVGDVIYAVYPEFGSQHGQILPTATYGVGSLHGLFTLGGPGLKKGHRLERTVWLTDLVPTICYALGLPVPADCDGAVVYQAFENPDFMRGQVEELKARLAELEKQLA